MARSLALDSDTAEGVQREKMTALGLPEFGPVQHNVSFNAGRGGASSGTQLLSAATRAIAVHNLPTSSVLVHRVPRIDSPGVGCGQDAA